MSFLYSDPVWIVRKDSRKILSHKALINPKSVLGLLYVLFNLLGDRNISTN
jgi:hypothetical protein